MYRPFIWAAIAVATVSASGDFIVLHSPASVEFKGKDEINQSLLKEVFTAALGFTVKQRGTWSGISITNPFDLPEAVVGIAIEGVESLESPRGKKFPLDVDEVEETTWQALSGRLEERDNDNTLVRICVGDGLDALGQSALGELKPTSIDERSLKSLSLKNEEDRKFLEEIKLLYAIAEKVPSAITADGKPDVYWLVVSGLRPVIDLHGKDSPAVKEALALLNDALSDISKAFMDVYSDKVVIAAFTNDASKVRHARSIGLARERREEKTAAIKDDSDKNDKTTENPPASTVIDSIKNDDDDDDDDGDDDGEESEKIKEEETRTGDIGQGSNLEKAQENPASTENDLTSERESSSTEPNESRDITSTEKSSQELDGTTLYNDHSNTDTENTNRPLKASDLNLGIKYPDSYPAVFNIILWFGVVFFFSLLAICITIADMDPGRDSIIYRMTSNRMKKDN